MAQRARAHLIDREFARLVNVVLAHDVLEFEFRGARSEGVESLLELLDVHFPRAIRVGVAKDILYRLREGGRTTSEQQLARGAIAPRIERASRNCSEMRMSTASVASFAAARVAFLCLSAACKPLGPNVPRRSTSLNVHVLTEKAPVVVGPSRIRRAGGVAGRAHARATNR